MFFFVEKRTSLYKNINEFITQRITRYFFAIFLREYGYVPREKYIYFSSWCSKEPNFSVSLKDLKINHRWKTVSIASRYIKRSVLLPSTLLPLKICARFLNSRLLFGHRKQSNRFDNLLVSFPACWNYDDDLRNFN